jgi:V8-like Glu-specific endopeptidase
MLASLLLASCADDAPNANPPELYDLSSAPRSIREAAKAVVRIQHPAGAAGSGSFISKSGLLLTNNHVLGAEECPREGCSFELSFDHQRGEPSSDAREVFGVPVNVDVGLDMAVLQVYEDASQRRELSTPSFLRFSAQSAKALIGTHVSAVGHPLGRLKKWSSGVVIDADGGWFESTVFSLPGSSGSPMLDDDGQIVGLLHRGTDGFDLLTRTSSQVSAIATASDALEAALEAPLPATVISLEAELTRAQVLAHTDAFLAGGVSEARVDGVLTPLLTLLGDACDEGLARDDYTSPEELTRGLSPCSAAPDFIECRRDVGPSSTLPTTCPIDPDAWAGRFETVVQRQLELNGSLDLSPLAFGLELLARDEAEGSRLARRAVSGVLEQTQPVYDFGLAPYLAALGIESYAGQGTVDLIKEYRRFPYYERSAWEITLSTLWLNAQGMMGRDTALSIARALYRDGKVSLGARLRIEEVLYNSGAL